MAEAVSGYAVVREDRDGAHLVEQTKQPDASSPAAGNIVEVPTASAPGQPPAPPGIVLKINHINGNIASAANLLTGTAQLPVDEPGNYTPPAGFSLVGGLTGMVGTNQVCPTVAAPFNSFQPTVNQLGLLTARTSVTATNPSGGLILVRQFTTVSQKAIQPGGARVEVPSNNSPPTGVGLSEGSVDSSLALNTIVGTPGHYTNTVSLLGPVSLTQRGMITLDTTAPITGLTAPITGLSESFRPELNGSAANGTGPALIDVQGNIQSLRGLTANGLVLNDTGYINLIRTGQISTSTILAQPIGHINTPLSQRSNDVLLISTNNRDFGTRGGVTLVPGLNQIGPLSLTNDSPNP